MKYTSFESEETWGTTRVSSNCGFRIWSAFLNLQFGRPLHHEWLYGKLLHFVEFKRIDQTIIHMSKVKIYKHRTQIDAHTNIHLVHKDQLYEDIQYIPTNLINQQVIFAPHPNIIFDPTNNAEMWRKILFVMLAKGEQYDYHTKNN